MVHFTFYLLLLYKSNLVLAILTINSWVKIIEKKYNSFIFCYFVILFVIYSVFGI